MRTINELLIILKDNAVVINSWFGLKQRINSGLCREVNRIQDKDLITEEELLLLYKHIAIFAPKSPQGVGYSWTKSEWKPRLKWLNKQIKLTK